MIIRICGWLDVLHVCSAGEGEGYNINYALEAGTDEATYTATLIKACDDVVKYVVVYHHHRHHRCRSRRRFPPRPYCSHQSLSDSLRNPLIGVVARYGPDYLIISLGIDTFCEDLISNFKLTAPYYATMAQHVAERLANVPTLIVGEGGYKVDQLGLLALNFLRGWHHHHHHPV